MGGLVIDIYVEYLVRIIINLNHKWKSRNWPTITASVTGSDCPRSVYGCHVADVYYEYEFDGEPYVGSVQVPFIYSRSGEDYVRRFPPKSSISLRVNPQNPAKSFPGTTL